MRKYYTVLFLALLTVVSSCTDASRYHESYVDFDEVYWLEGDRVSFPFEMESVAQPYRVKASFRNTLQYPYHNFYFEYALKDSAGRVLVEELKEIFFFDAKTGEPLGSGLGDYFDQSALLLPNYEFPYAGKYSMELRQMMRLDTLPYITSVGIRIEYVDQGAN